MNRKVIFIKYQNHLDTTVRLVDAGHQHSYALLQLNQYFPSYFGYVQLYVGGGGDWSKIRSPVSRQIALQSGGVTIQMVTTKL